MRGRGGTTISNVCSFRVTSEVSGPWTKAVLVSGTHAAAAQAFLLVCGLLCLDQCCAGWVMVGKFAGREGAEGEKKEMRIKGYYV